jgi:hypothetical protein
VGEEFSYVSNLRSVVSVHCYVFIYKALHEVIPEDFRNLTEPLPYESIERNVRPLLHATIDDHVAYFLLVS